MKELNKGEKPGAERDKDEIETEIDETLEETFPASDPPSWTLGTDHVVDPVDDVTEDTGQ